MPPPALYGRDEPLAALRAALGAARAGRGQLALISGEAGIGKSALAAAIAAEAEAAGFALSWGRAWEFADAPPYFPLWPCLRALGIEPASAEPGGLLDESRAFELWERVLSALARSSAGQPALFIVEDLHAADLGTLDLLALARAAAADLAGAADRDHARRRPAPVRAPSCSASRGWRAKGSNCGSRRSPSPRWRRWPRPRSATPCPEARNAGCSS